ncbi:MAG: glutathione S-transferase family protein [Pseudomonadota bacterium]
MAGERLIYFDMRGRAEAIRLTLHAMEIDFDDRRIMTADAWDALRPRTDFGGLPIFESATVKLSQYHAILRHLARAAGWLGHDEAQDTALDITQEALAEAQENLWRFAWVDGWRNKTNNYAVETLRPTLATIQSWCRRTGRQSGFCVGDVPTHVDFIAFSYLDEVDAFFPDVLPSFPDLSDLHRRVGSIPSVNAYLTSEIRPFVFGIGCDGPKVDPRIAVPEGRAFINPWGV